MRLGHRRLFADRPRLRHNHQANFDLVLFRKLVIALIVRRHAHDRAGAVIHQDVVRHPDRHLLAVIRIHREMAGVHAVLFDLADVARLSRLALLGDQLIDFLAQIGIIAVKSA